MTTPVLLTGATAVANLTLAAVVLRRAPGSAIAEWALAAALLSTGTAEVFHAAALELPSPEDATVWQGWRLAALAGAPGAWLVFGLTFAHEAPAHRSPRWQSLLAAACLVPVGLAAFQNESLALTFQSHRADGDAFTELGTGAVVLLTFMLGASLGAALSLERIHRAAHGLARWRSKFMIIGAACAIGGLFYLASQALLLHALSERTSAVAAAGELLATGFIARSLVRLGPTPLALHPSGPLLAGTVTLVLAGAYFFAVGLLARAASLLGGDTAFTLQSLLVVAAISTGALLLQSDRLRARLRQSVSLHLGRPLHDHRLLWRRFNAATNRCTAPHQLAHAIAQLISDELQTLSVSVWVTDETSALIVPLTSTGTAPTATPTAAESQAVVRHFQRHPASALCESPSAAWAGALRRWQPNTFHHGGPRLAAPLRRGTPIDGVIIVGDRVGPATWTREETDLLADLAEQTATALERLRLTERHHRHREWEAFQTMAAFFVHDLKNATTTLSLLLHNLPAHFDDPAFRDDARRDLAATTAHLDRLIARLGSLREGVSLELHPTELDALVRHTLASLPLPAGVTLTVNSSPSTPIPLDGDLFARVITNLILNATEAVGPAGRIEVQTSATDDHVTLTVRDDGCGMSPEFQRDGLFRPFRTTKRRGLGIGMFQSRMIVEAHGGSISVASAPGRGTTFSIQLPRTPRATPAPALLPPRALAPA